MDEPHRTTLRELTESINTLFTDVFLPRTLLSLLSLLLASVGLYLMGIQFWWGWALLIAAVAFLPLLAPFIVYLPLGIIYMAIGDFWLGVIIIIYGILVLDTLPFLYLSPYIKTHSPYHHPAILFISFVSGLLVFGVKGLILGPLAITLTLHFLYNTYTTISTPS
jgi:predicted PurR-regulated permease PerM